MSIPLATSLPSHQAQIPSYGRSMLPEKPPSPPEVPIRKRKICQSCSKGVAIYTCPRCSFQSCSLACTNAHKYTTTTSIQGTQAVQVCSGVRENNAGGYIDMNKYGYSAFVNDYVFLEDIGRKVSDWGRDLQTSGSTPSNHGHHRHGKPKTKREILKDQLEQLDIDMALLPQGMHRRKINQSTWETSTQKGFLTIEYRLHERKGKGTATLLTHRNELSSTLADSLRKAVTERKKGSFPEWVGNLIGLDGEVFENRGREVFKIQMEGPLAPSIPTPRLKAASRKDLLKRSINELDPSATLLEAFKGLSFVEFPTLDVKCFDETAGRSGSVPDGDDTGSDQDTAEEEEEEPRQRAKRQKVDKEAGRKLLGGLAVYGSDEEVGSDDTASQPIARPRAPGLGMLDYESDESEDEGDSDGAEGADRDSPSPARYMEEMKRWNEDEEAVDWDDN